MKIVQINNLLEHKNIGRLPIKSVQKAMKSNVPLNKLSGI